MPDHIKAARSIWGESAILPFGDLARFYALAYRQALEDAAKVCDEMSMICARTAPGSFDGRYDFMAESAKDCAEAIRALKEQQSV